jgi:hypothetical protein
MNRRIGTHSSYVLTAFFLLLPSIETVLAGEPPVVQFDLPKRLIAHNVVEATTPRVFRLVEVTVPVSARVVVGDVGKVKEITIEIDGGSSGLVVHDFAPQTTLGSDLASDIQVTTTTEQARTFDASLGGQSPLPLGDVVAQVAPSISAGNKNRTAETKTTSRLAPKRPIVVSGTLNEGRGAFFQLRPSSQTTLEGQHTLSVVFRVPNDWTLSHLDVRCWARGDRQILWFDQTQVWGSTRRTVAMAMAGLDAPSLTARPHLVAKQPTEDTGESWVPAKD